MKAGRAGGRFYGIWRTLQLVTSSVMKIIQTARALPEPRVCWKRFWFHFKNALVRTASGYLPGRGLHTPGPHNCVEPHAADSLRSPAAWGVGVPVSGGLKGSS